MEKNKLFLLIILLAFAASINAETVGWSVLPEYNGITRLNDDMFIIEKGARSAVIDAKGTEIVPLTLDTITAMVDGKSLLLSREKGDFRLRAIIFGDKHIVNVTGEYFVNDYPFFSEGMLPVYNKKGNYGYIDGEGRLVIDFKYRNIHPFSDGYASVSKVSSGIRNLANSISGRKPRVYYINMRGKELKLQKDIGDITMGSTFLNGESVVEDTNDNYFLINTDGRIVKRLANEELAFDDRYSVVCEEEKARPVKTSGPQPFYENRKYGYRSATGKIIAVPQFNYGYPFECGYAIVKNGAYWGILALKEGSVDVTKHVLVKRRKNVDEVLEYTVKLPPGYEEEPVSMVMEVNGDKVEEQSDSGETRQFKITTPDSDYKLYIASSNLILWSANEDVQSKMETAELMRVSVSRTSKADKNDRAPISIRITNPTDEEVSLEVKVTGENLSSVTKTLVIPEKSSRSIHAMFNKITNASTKMVSVTIDGKTSYFKVKITPFFVDF